LILLVLYSNVFGINKKVHLFPIFSSKSDLEFSRKYTKHLKINLQKTSVFTIIDVENFNNVYEKEVFYLDNLIKIVEDNSKGLNLDLVIIGYLKKVDNKFSIKLMLYSLKKSEIIEDYIDTIFNENEIENSSFECAVNFGYQIRKIIGGKILLYSALCPGFGQVITNKFGIFRGIVYFTGFTYGLVKYLTLGDKKSTIPWDSFVKTRIDDSTYLMLEGSNCTYGRWIWKMEENFEAYEFNEKLKKDKKVYFTIIGISYGLCLFDALISSKSYNDRTVVEKRVRFGLNIKSKYPEICINLRF
ncbi:hypothetical protein ACFL4T_01175, partial [candidate division KSB1 bacterium]